MAGADTACKGGLEECLAGFTSWCSSQPQLRRVADHFGVQAWIVVLAGSLCAVTVFCSVTADTVSTLVGHLYPMFASFRAMEDGHPGESREWLAYWVTYGSFLLAETLLSGLLRWIPFYFLLRLCFIAWLFWPDAAGAKLVYSLAVAPVLRLYRPGIEAALDKSTEAVSAVLQEATVVGGAAGAAQAEEDAARRQEEIQQLMTETLIKDVSTPLRRGGSQRRSLSPAPLKTTAERVVAGQGSIAAQEQN